MTVGKKIIAAFAAVLMLQAIAAWSAYRTTTGILGISERRARTHEALVRLERLLGLFADAETGQRGFLLTGREDYLEPYRAALESIPRVSADLKTLASDDPVQLLELQKLDRAVATKLAELALTIGLRRKDGFEAAQKEVLSDKGKNAMDEIRRILAELGVLDQKLVETRTASAIDEGDRLNVTLVVVFLVAIGASLGIAVLIARTLASQVGGAVQHIRSSSAELQAAATQQSSGMREQVSSMTEITTTIKELIATSRQITESAQRVTRIAEATGTSARAGDQIVQRAQESILAIKRQVDLVVTHMLDLGKRSQQIGSVLEVVNELLEQTNILAINATIEAAGAGENGRRFGAVADEIRKLADRVAGSAREIRGLVDEVRAAVNTTVMATEGGSKAVDAGTRQFGEVAASFKQIAGQVETTTDAAREIELSTKQQASAVEQVNTAISNVALTSRETEASATQTLRTASELATLSRQLARVVRSDARG